jgi:hypothetical protein
MASIRQTSFWILVLKLFVLSIATKVLALGVNGLPSIAIFESREITEWYPEFLRGLRYALSINLLSGIALPFIFCSVISRMPTTRKKYAVSIALSLIPVIFFIVFLGRRIDFFWKPTGVAHLGTILSAIVVAVSLPTLMRLLNYEHDSSEVIKSSNGMRLLQLFLGETKHLFGPILILVLLYSVLWLASAAALWLLLWAPTNTTFVALSVIVFPLTSLVDQATWYHVLFWIFMLTIGLYNQSRREFTVTLSLVCFGELWSILMGSFFEWSLDGHLTIAWQPKQLFGNSISLFVFLMIVLIWARSRLQSKPSSG